MKLFACAECAQVLFFDSVQCTKCGRTLAYLPELGVMSSLDPAPDAPPHTYVATAPRAQGKRYRLCSNYTEHGTCNWAVAEQDDDPLCRSCRLNDTIPNLSEPGALEAWQRLEKAKRRLIYTLVELGLPIESRKERPENGLAFSFMADQQDAKVFTGHSDGLITINVSEADTPFREKIRENLGETYRTVLGHFRHEIGHYYWDRLVKDSSWLEPCRELFGDERADYAEAMQRHYDSPHTSDWVQSYVSRYATMHPWEDWAETWAHYLHMVDTLETARSYGLVLRPQPVGAKPEQTVAARRLDFDDFDDLLSAWVPLTIALNSLNRSMGLPDLYPFVLSDPAIRKLRFVHDVVEHSAGAQSVSHAA